MIKKALKMIGLFIGGAILLIVVVGTLFVNLSPEFGGKPSKEQKSLIEKSGNYKNGKFINLGEVDMDMGFGKIMKMLGEYMKKHPNTVPEKNIDVEKIDSLAIVDYKSAAPRLIWFGHSAFLLQIDGKNILIDPMFGPVPAPHPMLGQNRFSAELPIEIEKIPRIDAVIFSHDHYDHLDYGSIMKLKEKVKAFYTPLGVGAHLEAWGVESSIITELDWWQEINHEDLRLICTPAIHFSGRGMSDRGSTLWSSWVIQSNSSNIFFSGDSGYGDHFKDIGNKFGPFDFAMMECGQYNELWKEIHMMPEETAQAAVDLNAKLMMPIHWGAFKLALHSWTDPVERVTKKAKELGLATTTPRIGEQIILGDSVDYPQEEWWLK